MNTVDQWENLVEFVSKELVQQGHQRPAEWARFLHADAVQEDQEMSVQRFLINRALRSTLATMPADGEDTVTARMTLIDSGPYDVWKSVIRSTVVPLIVRHCLPVSQ